MSTPLRQAAQQLEGVLLRQLLRESGVGRVEGTGSHVVTDFFVDALADAVERSGGLGLATMIERSLDPAASQAPTGAPSPGSLAAGPRPTGDLPRPHTALHEAATTHAHIHEPGPAHAPAAATADAGLLERLVVSDRVRTSSAYGHRTDPISGAHRFHHGVDMAAPLGSPIRSARAGVVTFAGEAGGYGLMVEIDHGDGIQTRYAHAQSLHVEAGQRVSEGQHIADVGSTGRSTGPHLHFEARRNGIPADPERLLQKSADGDEGS